MKINRKTGPPIQSIREIELPRYKKHTLDNGVPVYFVNQGSQSLIKLDIVFHGGRHAETYRTQSKAHGSLLKDGSKNSTSEQISDKIDFYGASYTTKSSLDYTTITVFCLTRFFEKLCPVISEILYDPSFPEKEIKKYIRNSQQNLKMSLSKNEMVAYRELSSLIFGDQNVYGYNTDSKDFEQNSKMKLLEFHHRMLQNQPCRIFISGKYDEGKILPLINQYFGQYAHETPDTISYHFDGQLKFGKHHFSSKNKHQVCLRMGRHFGNRKHPHYSQLAFLSNVLGGFFGSRLMKNIREDKGYTYNIYSDLDIYRYDGYFYLHTEMDKSYLEPVRTEIKKEFDQLKNQYISNEEIEMNKNYIMGNLMNAIDGPFNAINMIKSMAMNEIDEEDMMESIEALANMDKKTIQETANQYLNLDDFATVIVG